MFVDPDGHASNRQMMGLDDASIDKQIASGENMHWGAVKYAAKSTGYAAWNFLTGGFVSRHDDRVEARDQGKLSNSELWSSTALDAGTSAAATVIGGTVGSKLVGGGAIGGKVSAAISNKAGSIGTAAIASGVSAGFEDAMVQSAQVISHNVISEETGQKSINWKGTAQAVAFGAGMGGLGQLNKRSKANAKVTQEKSSGPQGGNSHSQTSTQSAVAPDVAVQVHAIKRIGANQRMGKGDPSARRAALNKKFGRSGNLNQDVSGSIGISNQGSSTSVKFDGSRVYGLQASKGGAGPNRWMRMNRSVSSTHGNSKNSEAEAVLYGKFDADGQFLKWGITQNLQTRYSSTELAGGRLKRYRSGLRSDMLARERKLTERFPGSDNKEPWAGAKIRNRKR